MDITEFSKVVENRITAIRSSLVIKGMEYSRNGERLHNFKAGGSFRDKHPAVMCWDYASKQIVSLNDLIEDIEMRRDMQPWSLYEEKIKDVINYTILLEALLRELMFVKEQNQERTSLETKVVGGFH